MLTSEFMEWMAGMTEAEQVKPERAFELLQAAFVRQLISGSSNDEIEVAAAMLVIVTKLHSRWMNDMHLGKLSESDDGDH